MVQKNENPIEGKAVKIKTDKINLFYAKSHCLDNITMDIYERTVTAIIGPSGCGKTSLLRVFNRMNDLIPIARVEGQAYIDGTPIYGKDVYDVDLRKKIGQVFQKPNIFPQTIRENLTIGPRSHGVENKAVLEETVERCLNKVDLWNDLKDKLDTPAQSLTAGEQQRLCIARTISVNPEVILMDESCSALDPKSTMKIEELMTELAKTYTIIIVTHSMEQARRVSDMSAFLMVDSMEDDAGGEMKSGKLVEYSTTVEMFSNPKEKRTEDYITGRYG
ncbi:MAG: phosphate ABC transporter ATP-binding protein [Defluviitaleaceae bacterium]|nr:phosphate ABC transporter ATP-binding protein [Defluviitaleaceae bacterium]